MPDLGKHVAARYRGRFPIEEDDGTMRPVTNIEMAAYLAFDKRQRRLKIQRGGCCGRTPDPDGTCLGEKLPRPRGLGRKWAAARK